MPTEATTTRNDSPDEATNPVPTEGGSNSNDRRNEDASSETMSELAYFFASFHAIVTPVTITMVLSAFAVVYINTDATRAAGEEAFAQSYEFFELDDGNSSQNLPAL